MQMYSADLRPASAAVSSVFEIRGEFAASVAVSPGVIAAEH